LIASTYLAGTNTRRVRRALKALTLEMPEPRHNDTLYLVQAAAISFTETSSASSRKSIL
jgi:hypothetical protein